MKFTVILVYPCIIDPTGTYIAWVDAANVRAAIKAARAEVFNSLPIEQRVGMKHADFSCVGVIAFWHNVHHHEAGWMKQPLERDLPPMKGAPSTVQ